MLTDVTVKVPPRPAIPDVSLALDELEGLDALEGDEDDDDEPDAPLAPERRPTTVTWCPTCSARLTPESATNLSSFVLPDERLELAVLLEALDGGLLDDGLPAGGVPACALSLLGREALELLLDPWSNFAFFSTKPPPPELLELAPPDALLLDGLPLVSLLDDPPPRCRQPVALVEPAAAPVDDCGVDVVGLCAASVAHSTTAVLSATAHCP